MVTPLKIWTVTILLLVFLSCNNKQSSKSKLSLQQSPIAELNGEQVLLTNHAFFTNNRELKGAVSFLIAYKNGIYAVTSKQYLGQDGGITPPIIPIHLYQDLLSWKMYPPNTIDAATDTVTITANELDYSNSTVNNDALLLSTKGLAKSIKALKPKFTELQKNDSLYLIGFNNHGQEATQTYYPIIYKARDRMLLICEIQNKIDLKKMVGAPLVNTKGEVVAIVYNGGEAEGKYYVYATHISEIKMIQ